MVTGEPRGTLVLVLRNLLLVAATVLSCARLWRSTVPGEPEGTAGRDGGREAVPAPRSTGSGTEPERDGVPGMRRPGGDRIPAPDAPRP